MVNNPQFPHSCSIYRLMDDVSDPLSGGFIEQPLIIDSPCQNQINEVGDVVYKEGVLFSDYTTYFSLETLIPNGGIQKGDIMVIDDGTRIIKSEVSQFEKGNIGIRIWSNGNKGE